MTGTRCYQISGFVAGIIHRIDIIRLLVGQTRLKSSRRKIPLLAEDEKRELTSQIQRLIDLIMKDVRVSAHHLEGRTSLYREAWSLIGERRRLLLRDLDPIRAILD